MAAKTRQPQNRNTFSILIPLLVFPGTNDYQAELLQFYWVSHDLINLNNNGTEEDNREISIEIHYKVYCAVVWNFKFMAKVKAKLLLKMLKQKPSLNIKNIYCFESFSGLHVESVLGN